MNDLVDRHMTLSAQPRQRSTARARPRRGVATLWLILFLPVILIALLMVVEIGRVWLARAELEDGLEAAALAGLTYWNTTTTNAVNARLTAQSYAAANSVLGDPLILANTEIFLGTVVEDTNGPFTDGGTPTAPIPAPPPPTPGQDAAVRVLATRTVPSQCIPWFSYSITAQATAVSRYSDPDFHLIP